MPNNIKVSLATQFFDQFRFVALLWVVGHFGNGQFGTRQIGTRQFGTRTVLATDNLTPDGKNGQFRQFGTKKATRQFGTKIRKWTI